MNKFESISCVEAIARLVEYRFRLDIWISHNELIDIMTALFGEDEANESVIFLMKNGKILLTDIYYEPLR